jgi:hypothetical protein
VSTGTGLFRILGDGLYHLAFPETGTEFTVDRLRRERHELYCELSVACGMVGARVIDGVLSVGTFNLSSPSAAQQRAKILAERARATGIDWAAMLEEVRQRVIAAERTGEPSILLRTVPRLADGADEFDILGITRPKHHAVITFGDGGTAKSYLELLTASELAKRGERVGYFDWEMDPFTHRRRLEAINGAEMPDVRYLRLDRPLIHEVDRLRRTIRQDNLTYAHLDSIGYGTAGAPESAEAAMDYFRAVRQLGIGCGLIAHITKGENGDQRPFGSAFWHNSARATWNIKLASTSPDGCTLHLAGFHRKSNLGKLRQPVGIKVDFDGDRVYFANVDVATLDEVAASLPLHVRVRGALRLGPQTTAQLASELDAKEDSVKKALTRGKGHTFTCITRTDDGVQRWALLEQRRSA